MSVANMDAYMVLYDSGFVFHISSELQCVEIGKNVFFIKPTWRKQNMESVQMGFENTCVSGQAQAA